MQEYLPFIQPLFSSFFGKEHKAAITVVVVSRSPRGIDNAEAVAERVESERGNGGVEYVPAEKILVRINAEGCQQGCGHIALRSYRLDLRAAGHGASRPEKRDMIPRRLVFA